MEGATGLGTEEAKLRYQLALTDPFHLVYVLLIREAVGHKSFV